MWISGGKSIIIALWRGSGGMQYSYYAKNIHYIYTTSLVLEIWINEIFWLYKSDTQHGEIVVGMNECRSNVLKNKW